MKKSFLVFIASMVLGIASNIVASQCEFGRCPISPIDDKISSYGNCPISPVKKLKKTIPNGFFCDLEDPVSVVSFAIKLQRSLSSSSELSGYFNGSFDCGIPDVGPKTPSPSPSKK